MTNHTKTWLVAAAVALAGVATAPAYSAAMAEQFAPHIVVAAPASPDALGTIWFDITDAKTSGVPAGGPR